MSIIFGISKSDGETVAERELLAIANATNRYALDGTFVRAKGMVGFGFQPYHTHQRSNLESQPVVDECANMVALDGRFDNHAELRDLLNIQDRDAADSDIALCAFQHWGEACFSRFVGDWAIAIWSEKDRALYLARDHAGTRTLYYEHRSGGVRWSTFLDTFFAESKERDFDETYAACYLTCRPVHRITPYKGLKAVAPAHYLVFQRGMVTERAHWQWLVQDEIRYQADEEYEDHFRRLFRTAVERRIGTGTPPLAELSGGMDSSSIVCMSDCIRREESLDPRNLVDTVSYYNEAEPNWQERPYFLHLEASRGKTGIHIDTSSRHRTFEPWNPKTSRYFLPGFDSASVRNEANLFESLGNRDYRVILSGSGGDELLGGVPSPFPELANYLIAAQMGSFYKRSLQWALAKRVPLLNVMAGTLIYSFNLYWRAKPAAPKLPPWISSTMGSKHLGCRESDFTVQGARNLMPSALSNGSAWWTLLHNLPHLLPSFLKRREFRYPFLDRDLVDFLFRIPREQLIGPSQRRRLMRNAMRGIVPGFVLERRRKAYIARGPLVELHRFADHLNRFFVGSTLEELEWVDVKILQKTLNYTIKTSDPTWMGTLMRAISLEIWRRSDRSSASLTDPGRSTN
jgi:asparagine synthase (glutamine-hydrolysing)